MKKKRIIKKFIVKCVVFSFALAMFLPTYSIDVYADNGSTIVHVTQTGSCYHTADCGHLRSDIKMTLYEAYIENGYVPCSDCHPPIYDGPEEPLDKKQKHSSSSSGSRSNSGTVKKSTTIKPTPTSNPKDVGEKEQSNSRFEWVLGGILVLVFGAFVRENFADSFKVVKMKRELRKWEKEEREANKQKYTKLYEGKDPLSLVNVPDGAFIKDGYPCTKGSDSAPYGKYTVYVGRKNAEVFHFNPKCGGANLKPMNYYDARLLRHCKRCAAGGQKLPRLDWYMQYLEIKRVKDEYNIR